MVASSTIVLSPVCVWVRSERSQCKKGRTWSSSPRAACSPPMLIGDAGGCGASSPLSVPVCDDRKISPRAVSIAANTLLVASRTRAVYHLSALLKRRRSVSCESSQINTVTVSRWYDTYLGRQFIAHAPQKGFASVTPTCDVWCNTEKELATESEQPQIHGESRSKGCTREQALPHE